MGLGKGLGALLPQTGEVKQGIQEIAINEIFPNPEQPRKVFDEAALHTLSESIKEFGLVQPIVVRKVDNGYQIVAGERRWRACKHLGMENIPAILKDYSTEETTEIALIENLQRENLDPIEEAHAYERLITVFKLTQENVAKKIGRSRSHVANILRLLQLPEFLRDELSGGELTIGQVRPLLALKSVKQQKEALLLIKEKELNARQVEDLVRKLLKNKTQTQPSSLPKYPEIKAWEDEIKMKVGYPVDIKMGKGKKLKGKIEIKFSDEEELGKLLQFFDVTYTE